MQQARFTDIRRFDSIDSTNRYLLDQARAGAPEGVVAVADHQLAGRGRLGRRWEAPPGSNLLVSVLLRPDLPLGQRYLAGAVVALAAADAMATVAGVAAGLKWPNDLLAPDGRKLAGVLAEADLGTGGPGPADPGTRRPTDPTDPTDPVLRPPIVVGIGINVGWPVADDDLPDDLAGTATSLRQQAGHPVDRDALLAALLAALDPRLAALGTAGGCQEQAADLRRRCATIGSRVRVELAGGADEDRVFEGMATGVTDEGHLVVASGGRARSVVAGDVVHVRPAG